ASVNGGSAPVTGFHSTMDKPDSVSRVAPPTTTISAIRLATRNSQRRRPRGARCGGMVVIPAQNLETFRPALIVRPRLRASRAPHPRRHVRFMAIRTRKFIGTILLLLLVRVRSLLGMSVAQFP